MALAGLFFGAFLTALSGALMPGPVLFVTVRHAAAGRRWVGARVVLGHAVVEVPLMLAVILGLGELLRQDLFFGAVGVAGGLVLLGMGALMLRSLPGLTLPRADGPSGSPPDRARGLVAAGALTSVSNPYFLVWWATIGMGFLASAAPHGAVGYAVFYLGHVLADLVWYEAVGASVRRGSRLMSDGSYRRLVGVCALLLAAFAVWFAAIGLGRLT